MFKLVQVTVSAGLLALALRRVDLRSALNVVDSVDLTVWAAGFVLTLLTPLVVATRFRVLLAGAGYRVSLGSILTINLEAMFFTLVLPGDLIGGVVRWIRVGQHTGRRGGAFGLILFERLLDWFSLGTGVAVGASLLFEGPDAVHGRRIVLALGCSIATAAALTIVAARSDAIGRFAARSGAVARGRIATWLFGVMRSAWGGLHETVSATRAARIAAAVTFGYWLLAVCAALAMARAVHPGLPVLPFVAASCAIGVLSQLPLTIAGLGLREVSFPLLLSAFGVTREVGLVIGLGAFAPTLTLCSVGALLHLLGRSRLVASAPGKERLPPG